MVRVRHEHGLRIEDGGGERGERDRSEGRRCEGHRLAEGTHLSLPARRDERRRYDPGSRRLVPDELCALGRDGRGLLDRTDLGAAERSRHPERPGHDLAVRLRHDHVVRLQDLEPQRGLGHESPQRGNRDLRPEGVDDLSLPNRGLELRRHDCRQRQDVLDLARTRDRHRAGPERRLDGRDARRHRRSARTADDLVVRVRRDCEIRRQDGREERRLEKRAAERRRGRDRPQERHDLPLPAGRQERCRHDVRVRPDVRDSRRARLPQGDARSSSAGGSRSRARCRPMRSGSR